MKNNPIPAAPPPEPRENANAYRGRIPRLIEPHKSIKITSILLLLCSAALTLGAHAAGQQPAPAADRLPAFSWDRVPQYMHIRKAKEFTEDEIRYLASFPLVTFEKTTGFKTFNSTEDGTLAAARAVKEVNPDTKILYYRNVIVHYGTYRANEDIGKIPGAFLVGREGKTKLIRGRLTAYDLTNPELRDWWVDHAGQICADPAIDGLFLDGNVKVLLPSFLTRQIGKHKKRDLIAGYRTMMGETRKALGTEKMMIANVLRDRIPDGGLEDIKQFDGSYIEGFEGPGGTKKDMVANGIERLGKAARDGFLIAFTAGLSDLAKGQGNANPGLTDEIRKGLGNQDDHSRRFEYLLALFLTIAEEHSYFLAHDGYAMEKSKVWMKRPEELERPLGPPKGPASRDGYVYTREFAHAKVRLDIENEVGKIEWLEPDKIRESQPHAFWQQKSKDRE